MSIKPKKLLLGIVVVLLITNLFSLLLWNKAANNDDELLNDEDEEKPVEKEDDEVASVEGEKITYQDWMASLRNTEGESHLKEMINKSVVEKLSEQNDVTISDKIIEREIAFLTTMNGIMDEDEIAEQEEEWEEELRYRYQLEALLTEDVNIPEEEVRDFYDSNENQYDFSTSFQLSHIVVPDMDAAEKVTDELSEGASFDLLAKEYSLDEDTVAKGGYLGYFTEGNQFIPYGYDDQIEDMEEHTYSEPFRVDSDVAIIYLHRDISEVTFTYEEIEPYITWELAMEEIEQNASAELLWDKSDVEWVYE